MRIIAQAAIVDSRHFLPASVGEMAPIYDLAAEMGLTDIRFSVPWFLLRYQANAWDERWAAPVDAHVAAINARGMGAVPTLVGMSPPCWSSDFAGKDCTTYTGKVAAAAGMPSDMGTLEDHVTACCDRWDLAGIEVTNEPNHPNDDHTPAQDAAIAAAVRAGVDASTTPDVPVLGGSLSQVVTDPNDDEAEYLQQMYDEGLAASIDLLVLHPYGLDLGDTPWTQIGPSAYLAEEVGYIRDVVAVEDPGRKFVYNEMGWTTGDFNGAITPITEQQKGDWLAEGLLWQAAQPDTEIAGFFAMYQPFDPIGLSHFGVIDQFKRKTYSWYAVKEAIEQING